MIAASSCHQNCLRFQLPKAQQSRSGEYSDRFDELAQIVTSWLAIHKLKALGVSVSSESLVFGLFRTATQAVFPETIRRRKTGHKRKWPCISKIVLFKRNKMQRLLLLSPLVGSIFLGIVNLLFSTSLMIRAPIAKNVYSNRILPGYWPSRAALAIRDSMGQLDLIDDIR